MNKAYKVIWSKVRNCYMVVSELAKRNGKCSSALNKKIIAAFLASGLLLSVQGETWAAADKSTTSNATALGAGSADTDAVNVAQLKLASSLTSDNRNVSIIVNEQGIKEISSPYIHLEGVESATSIFSTQIAKYLASTAYTSLSDEEKPSALALKVTE